MKNERKEKFTPGTYTAKPETPYVAAQVWADGMLIADVYGESRKARKANAQLFAAAPAMYEALSQLWNYVDQGVLVRNIEHDGEPDWAMRMLQLTRDLALMRDALDKVQGVRP